MPYVAIQACSVLMSHNVEEECAVKFLTLCGWYLIPVYCEGGVHQALKE
jgi:hypothetical protein